MATSARIEAGGRHPLATAKDAAALDLDGAGLDGLAIHNAVQQERARRWSEENAGAIAGWKTWVEENGLPLARYRMF